MADNAPVAAQTVAAGVFFAKNNVKLKVQPFIGNCCLAWRRAGFHTHMVIAGVVV